MNYNIEELQIENQYNRTLIENVNGLTFLPENFETAPTKNDFIFTESLIELNKYFKLNNVKIISLEGGSEIYRSRKSADIYLPAIFIGFSAFAENPNIVSVVLNVVSSYIYDNLKGKIGTKTAKIEFYIEKKEKGKITKIDYKGSAEGLKELENIIKLL
ncbi:hypothetical protein [Flavobacterium sp. TAB 87]|uniref:hypothetical protein n=1 Tax=Flavobacterium sp. TAB 87 TaxID=1729581 RepID=UPI00076C064C|nr:hypothetical protein [Flavobacterium sp. TAB 87]KVV16402.1 hypothetical protein AP058_00080 [Flavobacterium sp. TAB 87]